MTSAIHFKELKCYLESSMSRFGVERRDLPQSLDGILQRLEESAQVRLRVIQPEGDHQRPLCVGKIATDGQENVRGLKSPGSTG